MNSLQRVWLELSRRHVVRVTLAYGVVAYALIQFADDVISLLALPAWSGRLIVALVLLGLPVTVALAWAFDLKDGRIERTSAVDAAAAGAGAADPGAGAGDASGGAGPRAGGDVAEAADRAARDPVGPATEERHPRTAIAVLPFANLSGSQDNEYFSDGITDDLLTSLARTGRLRVISRTSVMRYKNTTKPLREIAAELRVGSIVEGSVRRSGERVRISAQLIDAKTDEHLWADTYDRDLADIFGVQTEVATSIARALRQELSPEAKRRVHDAPTQSMEAYDLLLQARQLFQAWDPAKIRRSIELYEMALSHDPGLARAWAGIADSLVWLRYFSDSEPARLKDRMTECAERAVEAHPDGADGHYAAGVAASEIRWAWAEGRAHIQRCVEINPGHSLAYTHLAAHGTIHLRHEEALRYTRQALDHNPFGLFEIAAGATRNLYAGRFEEAARLAAHALWIEPRYYFARVFYAPALAALGRPDEAMEHADRARRDSDGLSLAVGIASVVAAGVGRAEYARGARDELVKRRSNGHVSAYALAVTHAALGEWNAALDALELAVEERDTYLPYLVAAGRFRPLQAEPRYQAVLAEIFGDAVPALPAGDGDMGS